MKKIFKFFDSDFPTSGVFSEEVYANSPFQTLTVHTDAPLPALHEEPAELESTIEFGLLGNGITVYDTARTQPHSSDYLTVAHISEEGNVQYYAEVTDSDRKRIEAEASRQIAKFTAEWNAKPQTEQLLTIMQTANPTQLVQILADKLPADQLIAKYEKSIIFRSEEFPETKAVHLVITNAGFDGGIDDKKNYVTLGGAIAAGRAYLADDYLGFAVYNMETKQIEHIEGNFPVSQAFNPEILRLNGMTAEADEAEREMRERQQEIREMEANAIRFQNADLAGFLADRTLSSDEWEDMAYPLYDTGYIDKHQPSEKGAFGYHLSETALYDLARRFHAGEDIRRELALSLLDNNETARIEFCFEDGKISDRTFYHPESERHTLETVRTDTGFNCTFNGVERTVSFEEIGQAFLDHIYDEFNDLAFWWVRDDLHEAIPDMTDEQMRDLIAAFDRELTPEWENADYAPIKQALTDVLGDAEQAEKAFAIIAVGKYHVTVDDDQPPVIEDGKPLSNLITFVRDENQRVLDGLEVGDQISIPDGAFAGMYEVTMIHKNHSSNHFQVTSLDGKPPVLLMDKDELLYQAGNLPISVIKSEAVRQIDELNAVMARYAARYDELYEKRDAVDGFSHALAVGDAFIQEHPDYVQAFNALRGDILSSDREVAAFSFALADCNVIAPFTEQAAEAETEQADASAESEPLAEPEPAVQPEAEEPAKRRGRLTRPEELYKLLSEMYPQIISGEHSHEHYEGDPDSGYEPLSVEMIGDDLYSFMTYY
ncbi:MAG: hypothetical protein IKI37_09180, partial [Oscillospiraceae bacterium]|nr:hypothetical protein [Oscillospiraceae bacterium]